MWEEVELDGLGQRECAGNDRLRRDDGRQRGESNKAIVKPARGKPIERIIQRLRMGQQQSLRNS